MQRRGAGCHPISGGGGKKKKKAGATGNPAATALSEAAIAADKVCDNEDKDFDQEKCDKAQATYDKAKEAYQKAQKAAPGATTDKGRQGNAAPVDTAGIEQAKADAAEARRLVEELKKQKAGEVDPSAALIEKYDAAISEETNRAQEAEGKLLKGQTALGKRVKAVEKKLAEGGGGISPLFEANLGIGSLFGNGASIIDKTGATVGIARGNISPGVQVGVLAGIDSSLLRFNSFANLLVTYEQGSHGAASGLAWQVGLEAPFHIGTTGHAIGPNVKYDDHEAGGSVAGANSRARGGSVGVTYLYMSGNRWKLGPIARFDIGGESLGAGSGQKATAQTSFVSTLSVGFNFGVSAPSVSQENDDE